MTAVTIVALAILAYTYFGYPLVLALCARLFPQRIEPVRGFLPVVSALIPAYNAAAYVRAKLDSLLAQDYPRDRLEILVCSDASDDETDGILHEYAARDARIRVFRAVERRGKPHAVNWLRSEARGEVLLMTDIRQPLSPGAVTALVETLSDPRVGCVSGNLILRGLAGAGVYWRYESFIRRAESAFRSVVGVTGPIYCIRKQDMGELPPDLILDDLWVPSRLRLAGRLILLDPRAEAYDDAFEDDRELGRKIRTLAGNYQLFLRLPRLLVPFVNPSWFETFSHKLLRLAAPWMLLALLAGSLALALSPPDGAGGALTWGARALLAGQVAFYSLAAIGPAAGKAAAVARTFVVLNYAALAGLARFLRGRQRVTW